MVRGSSPGEPTQEPSAPRKQEAAGRQARWGPGGRPGMDEVAQRSSRGATATLAAEGQVQRSQTCPRSRAHGHDGGKQGAAGEAGVLRHGQGWSCSHSDRGLTPL